MKKQMLLVFILLSVVGIMNAQKRANPQDLVDRNEKLEILLLEYKEQLQKTDEIIRRLQQENYSLTKEIGSLTQKKDKSREDIKQLIIERQRLLENKIALEENIQQRETTIQLLEEANKKLAKDNQILKSTNAILEEAAMASDTIQLYLDLTIREQEESIKELMSSYAQRCSEITGQYRTPITRDALNVVLDGEEKGPEGKYIESITVTACFQVSDETSNEKVLVYFTLFDKDTKRVVRKVKFLVPKTYNSNNVSYYEGTHTLNTQGRFILSDTVKYYYEITYLENVVAKGALNPS
jgi:hypothetical protein